MATWSAFIGFFYLPTFLGIFSCFNDNASAHKAETFANFWHPKKYNTLSPHALFRIISATLFSLFQVENKFKRTPLCGCCWNPNVVIDELNKVQKEEISAAFQKMHDPAKACMYANGTYFEWKRYVFLMCLRFLKHQF